MLTLCHFSLLTCSMKKMMTNKDRSSNSNLDTFDKLNHSRGHAIRLVLICSMNTLGNSSYKCVRVGQLEMPAWRIFHIQHFLRNRDQHVRNIFPREWEPVDNFICREGVGIWDLYFCPFYHVNLISLNFLAGIFLWRF